MSSPPAAVANKGRKRPQNSSAGAAPAAKRARTASVSISEQRRLQLVERLQRSVAASDTPALLNAAARVNERPGDKTRRSDKRRAVAPAEALVNAAIGGGGGAARIVQTTAQAVATDARSEDRSIGADVATRVALHALHNAPPAPHQRAAVPAALRQHVDAELQASVEHMGRTLLTRLLGHLHTRLCAADPAYNGSVMNGVVASILPLDDMDRLAGDAARGEHDVIPEISRTRWLQLLRPPRDDERPCASGPACLACSLPNSEHTLNGFSANARHPPPIPLVPAAADGLDDSRSYFQRKTTRKAHVEFRVEAGDFPTAADEAQAQQWADEWNGSPDRLRKCILCQVLLVQFKHIYLAQTPGYETRRLLQPLRVRAALGNGMDDADAFSYSELYVPSVTGAARGYFVGPFPIVNFNRFVQVVDDDGLPYVTDIDNATLMANGSAVLGGSTGSLRSMQYFP